MSETSDSTTTEPREIDKPWRTWAAAIVLFIIAFGAFCGLVLIPVVQGRAAGVDAWTAICRAVGVAPGSPAVQQPVTTAPAHPTTEVAWTPEIVTRLNGRAGAAGARTAEICAGCHGAQGIAPTPAFPDIAGQSAFAIYKQLHDYRNGARVNEQMAAVVAGLSDDEMADVAVHWSSQSAGGGDPRAPRPGDPAVVALVQRGDIARGVPACSSCHGLNSGGPLETPSLGGQRAEYTTAQLRAFRSGQRRNDIYHRMRAAAAPLTDAEITALAAYYGRVR